MKYFYKFIVVILICLTKSYSQEKNSYKINIDLDEVNKVLSVKQRMTFHNNYEVKLEKIILEDWANSYVNNKTSLAKRISDEYSRIFAFANSKQLGYTDISRISSKKIKSWKRSDKNSDIIIIDLESPLESNEIIEIDIDYSIKLPDSKFTGYGYSNKNIYLKNWLIVFSNIFNKKWLSQTNLNLDDQSIDESKYEILISFNKNLDLVSNLNIEYIEENQFSKVIKLNSSSIKEVKINLLSENNFKRFINNDIIVDTDIFSESPINESEYRFVRVTNFISDYFNDYQKNTFLVQRIDYDLKPFYGLNQLPGFLRPFSNKFLEEIIFLKSYLINYLNKNINLNEREIHWLYNGLEIFLIDKYIQEYYPKVKFLGSISAFKFLKKYKISKLGFSDLFLNYSEYVQRLNLHQLDDQSSKYLTRINEEIASPYHSGIGIKYLEKIIGNNELKKLINKIGSIDSRRGLNNLFIDYKKKDLNWFINDYLGNRQSIDLRIKNTGKNEVEISEKNNIKIPFSLGLLKNDSILHTQVFKEYKKIKLPSIEYEYAVINPTVMIPEFNRNNNWLYNSKSNIKPLRLKFISDVEDPKYRNLYFRPEITYNFYDGISPGINLLNRGLKNKPFTYEIFSQYASKEDAIIGSLNFKYQINNEIKNNYSTIFNLIYTTNHYRENLRYQVFSPSVQINYRDNSDLRSNVRKSLLLSMFHVNKENFVDNNDLNNYSIFNLGYYYSDIGIIKYLKGSINSEFSNNFGKLNLVFDYRRLLKSNRQFQARIYFGKFFWNNNRFDNFKYNLGRPGGYLFLANYLGRSERTGILSQQFIMAGGGFKSFFENPTSNNFMLTSNLNIGIWKWIEGYIDLGILKNKREESRYFYGTGLRLNLLPDFFELYFPINSSNGFEMSQPGYTKRIRFIISYNLESLTKLFSRRWL